MKNHLGLTQQLYGALKAGGSSVNKFYNISGYDLSIELPIYKAYQILIISLLVIINYKTLDNFPRNSDNHSAWLSYKILRIPFFRVINLNKLPN